MKKILTLTLALMMALSLAACGGKDDPKPSGNSGAGDTPPASTQQEPATTDPGADQPGNKGSEQSSGDVFDITDGDIRAYASDLMTTLTGDEAAELIAKIPAEIKKGVGELGKGLCNIAPDLSGDGSYNFGASFIVPKGSEVDYYTKLTDYYKTLDGTVTDETVMGDHYFFEMEFSWGTLWQCEIGAYNEENAAIVVGFNIKP